MKEFIPEEVKEVIRILRDHGFSAYLVGGFIRDILIKRNTNLKSEYLDIDIATSAQPEKVIALFEKVIPTGIKHGTVTVLYKNYKFEITTYRTESGYVDKRHPDSVQYIESIEEDLARRDFTINAIAYDPLEDLLVDPFNGYHDLIKNIVRTVGDPNQRFEEDGLRLIRAIRFSCALNFEIEENTFKAIIRWKDHLEHISKERIREEFNKILLSSRPSVGIEMLRKAGLLSLILPELEEGYGVDQNAFHKYDVYWHNLYSCDASQTNIILRLSSLLHDIGKTRSLYEYKGKGFEDNVFYNHEKYSTEIAKNFMQKYRYSNKEIEMVTKLIQYHMFHYTREWTEGAVRRFVKKVGEELIPFLFSLRVADRAGNGNNNGYPQILLEFYDKIQQVIEEEHALKITDLDINGKDIMRELNLTPSPLIGKILLHLLELVLENQNINKYDELLSEAKKYLNGISELKH